VLLWDPVSHSLHGFLVFWSTGFNRDVEVNNPVLQLEFEAELRIRVPDAVQPFVYHDEHGRDERHVEYDLDAVVACGEEMREGKFLFQETEEIMISFT
jgi:hypothetical protein